MAWLAEYRSRSTTNAPAILPHRLPQGDTNPVRDPPNSNFPNFKSPDNLQEASRCVRRARPVHRKR